MRFRSLFLVLAGVLLGGGCATPPAPLPKEAEADSADIVRIMDIEPSGDALLATGERVHVSVEYRLDSREGAFLLIRPYHRGLPAPGHRAHVGIPVYRGEGRERGWIEFATVAEVDEVRATLADQQTLSVITAASRPVDLRWRDATLVGP